MKAISLLSLLVLVSPLTAQPEVKAPEKPLTTKQPSLQPNQQAFLNLPEESRKEFAKHLGESTRLFQQKRIFETLTELDKATKVFEDSPEVYNLRGSCFVEMRAFDKALEEFEKARLLAVDNASIEFNIAEVYFCTKEWKKAKVMFEKIMKDLPPGSLALGRLVEFKLLLCMKKLGMDAEAARLTEKYDYRDDSPFYYFANAVTAYDKKDLLKAEEWLGIAGRVFQQPTVIAPWEDTLVEYGYIKSFYGEETPE